MLQIRFLSCLTFVKLGLVYSFLFFSPINKVCTQTVLPPNIYGDTLHAPFYYGVASGDPLSDRIIIWTKITPENSGVSELTVEWEMATDTSFLLIAQTGSSTVNAETDWTVKTDVEGLMPNTVYYYRFMLPDGSVSTTGRTKTSGIGNVPHLRLGVASCSSVFSGFFNAYRQIAEEPVLDAFIHLGDYIYDFVDPEEQIRVPQPYPQNPINLAQWRERHAYYLLDPDLRAARCQHPWIAIWDNHDIEQSDWEDITGSKRAFWEYLPIRSPDTANVNLIYRSFKFGDLLHLMMLDVLLHRNESEISPGVPSMLGNTQYNWLEEELTGSEQVRRVIGSSKMVGTWSLVGLPPLGFGDGDVADLNTWDGFPEERLRVLQLLNDLNLSDNLFLSGDSHISMMMDLPYNPLDSLTYDKSTGQGSVAIEMLPTSISRGNFDESGIPPTLINIISNLFRNLNPHELYNELTQHGYGFVDITADSLVAEIRHFPILTQSNTYTVGTRMVSLNGQNHWDRESALSTTFPTVYASNEFTIFPNPAQNKVIVKFQTKPLSNEYLTLTNLEGKTIKIITTNDTGNNNQLTIDLNSLEKGYYIISYRNKGLILSKL